MIFLIDRSGAELFSKRNGPVYPAPPAATSGISYRAFIWAVFCVPDSTNDSVLEEMKKAYMVEQESKEMKQ